MNSNNFQIKSTSISYYDDKNIKFVVKVTLLYHKEPLNTDVISLTRTFDCNTEKISIPATGRVYIGKPKIYKYNDMNKQLTLFILMLVSIISSCSNSSDDVMNENAILENTVRTRQILLDGYKLTHYETLEFFSDGKYFLSEYNLDGVRIKYLTIGDYQIKGTEVTCTHDNYNYNASYNLVLKLDVKDNSLKIINEKDDNRLKFIKQ